MACIGFGLQLILSEPTGARSAELADVRIPKIFTAKAYAEHLSGAPLTDTDTIKKLRDEAAQAFQATFNKEAQNYL